MSVNSFNAQNPPVTTKGDVFTFSTIPTRLGVGANDTVLTADSTAATGLKWATPSSGGMTLLSTTSLSGANTTVSSIAQTYNDLLVIVQGATWLTADAKFEIRPNSSITTAYASGVKESSSTVSSTFLLNGETVWADITQTRTNADNAFYFLINDYTSTSPKPFTFYGTLVGGDQRSFNIAGALVTGSAISSIRVQNDAGYTLNGGTMRIYGVK